MRPPIGHRSDYAFFQRHTTRWNDNDLYGHLNNAIYHTLFDTTVNAWLMANGLLDPLAGATIPVIAENGCRFYAEMRYPQDITVGIRIAHLGRSSLRYELALFADAQEEASAEGFFVQVYVDRQTRRPTPIPDEIRAGLTPLLRLSPEA